jgi:hypothetical protein
MILSQPVRRGAAIGSALIAAVAGLAYCRVRAHSLNGEIRGAVAAIPYAANVDQLPARGQAITAAEQAVAARWFPVGMPQGEAFRRLRDQGYLLLDYTAGRYLTAEFDRCIGGICWGSRVELALKDGRVAEAKVTTAGTEIDY